MISMIRNLLILFFVSSCANVDLGYINLFNDRLSANKITNLQPFYNTNFSFIRITRGRNQAIFILGDYKDGMETWYGPQKELIQTYKGLIISTEKLPFNIKFNNIDVNKFPFEEMSSGYITLFEPRADYLEFKFLKINVTSSDECSTHYSFERIITTIRNKEIFNICYDSNGRTIYSRQRPHPLDKEILIEYFYQ